MNYIHNTQSPSINTNKTIECIVIIVYKGVYAIVCFIIIAHYPCLFYKLNVNLWFQAKMCIGNIRLHGFKMRVAL